MKTMVIQMTINNSLHALLTESVFYKNGID